MYRVFRVESYDIKDQHNIHCWENTKLFSKCLRHVLAKLGHYHAIESNTTRSVKGFEVHEIC
jgi:hypothetical protein